MPSTDRSEPLLTLEHVDKSFGDTKVLHDISLTLEEGEILFLLGASGCGKTTLLRLIAGFEVADAGRMRIGSNVLFDAHRFVPPRDRRLGYVLQEGVLFPHLNVYRNIAYGLGNGKGKTPAQRQRIEEVMALTDITALAERMPHQLSGGQQQRVALARALAPRPTLMLLDEPFSALDEHLRARIRNDITDILRRSQSSAIIVTHDRREALSCADKIGLIQNGRLVQLATPREIYQRPGSVEIARFICDQSVLLPAHLSDDGCCAECALAQRIPVHVMSQAPGGHPAGQPGQILLRANQFLPVAPDRPEAQFTARVRRIEFHGQHSQLDLDFNGMPIRVDVRNELEALRVGDPIGLQVVGKGVFYH